MRNKIKTTLSKTPKFVALTVLAIGFVYAGRQLADQDPYLTIGAILLAVLLVDKAK